MSKTQMEPVITKYYSIAGQRVAMKGPEGLQYLLTGHLGSVVAVTDDDGVLVSEQRTALRRGAAGAGYRRDRIRLHRPARPGGRGANGLQRPLVLVGD